MSKLLKKLDKQIKKATPAPWQYFGDAGLYPPTYKDGDSDNSWFITTEDRHGDDAALIAALHRAYPKLRAVVEAAADVSRFNVGKIPHSYAAEERIYQALETALAALEEL